MGGANEKKVEKHNSMLYARKRNLLTQKLLLMVKLTLGYTYSSKVIEIKIKN
jgi:hypothetical protein